MKLIDVNNTEIALFWNTLYILKMQEQDQNYIRLVCLQYICNLLKISSWMKCVIISVLLYSPAQICKNITVFVTLCKF